MNKLIQRALVCLCVLAPGSLQANAVQTLRSYAEKAVAMTSRAAAAGVGAVASSWSSLALLGAGIAVGCKMKDLVADKKRLLRYTAVFVGGVGVGIIAMRWPSIFWTAAKIAGPTALPIGVGYLACNGFMRHIGIS